MRVFIATILFIGAAILYGTVIWLAHANGRDGWAIILAFFGALGVYDLGKKILLKADLIHPDEDDDSALDQ